MSLVLKHPPMNHLDDQALQGLADGTLRGPEGLEAHGHCDDCAGCKSGLEVYAALTRQLSALEDPPLPEDFTFSVLAAVEARESFLAQRRHTWLATIPAAALALLAMGGWALSAGPAHRIDQLVSALAFSRHFTAALEPVLSAARLPLGAGALAFTLSISLLLTRAIRAGRPGQAEASAAQP